MIADETVARAADSALAPSTLPAPLPGGVEVRILERRSPWIRIRLANGRDAWVAESALMPVVVSRTEPRDSMSGALGTGGKGYPTIALPAREKQPIESPFKEWRMRTATWA